MFFLLGQKLYKSELEYAEVILSNKQKSMQISLEDIACIATARLYAADKVLNI